MRELLPSLKLIRGSLLRTLLLGLLLSCVASLAAIGLLGLSGWFITMSALVGIFGSTSFSYFFPSAGVRAFALFRTVGRYGERTVNHQATFLFLARLRIACFDGALRLPMCALATLRSGDLLNRVMADIDTLAEVHFHLSHFEQAVELEKKCVRMSPDLVIHRKQLERYEAGLKKQKAGQ